MAVVAFDQVLVSRTRRVRLDQRWIVGGGAALVLAMLAGLFIGPAGLPWRAVVTELYDALPFVSAESGLSTTDHNILWKLRLPRVVLGALVGAMLSGGGAAYQGVFRNPLADPYLLGVAAGAGLGATIAIAYGPSTTGWPIDPLPVAAFVGAIAAVALTYGLGAAGTGGRSTTTIVLAGVAVASFFTAIQTYLQQRESDSLREVYSWILGRVSTSGWHEVKVVLPYVIVSGAVLLSHRHLLDALRVGELEATSLGVDASRVRLTVVFAATLGTAAVVAVSGLIGFVGIIVPHCIRLVAGGSYRRIVPLSLLLGGAFVVLADILARSLASGAELPIGVITAFIGAPFFVVVLRTRRTSV